MTVRREGRGCAVIRAETASEEVSEEAAAEEEPSEEGEAGEEAPGDVEAAQEVKRELNGGSQRSRHISIEGVYLTEEESGIAWAESFGALTSVEGPLPEAEVLRRVKGWGGASGGRGGKEQGQ